MKLTETFVSVDIEASGPVPGEYSMLSLGACVVGDTDRGHYVELKPISDRSDPEALAVAGLDPETLKDTGAEPAAAMAGLEAWLKEVTAPGHDPVFVGFPVAFDWMFVAYYFHRFLGRNPFGVSGLDIRSFYAGMTGVSWTRSQRAAIERAFQPRLKITHHALEDAVAQGQVFEQLLAYRSTMDMAR